MNKLIDLYPLMIEALSNGLTFTFPTKGTSMRPMLYDNDPVTIEKIGKVKKGDIVLFRRLDGVFVLHRVRRIKNDLYTFVGDHQRRVEKGIAYNQLIGKVISYRRKDKEKSLSGFKYSIYKMLVKSSIIRAIFGRIY